MKIQYTWEKQVHKEELYSLYTTICRFALPRLKQFKEVSTEFMEKDIMKIDEIIDAFELIVRNSGVEIWSEDERNRVEKGIQTFHEYFFKLWY